MIFDPFVLGTNRERVHGASNAVARIKSRSHEERASSRRDEYAKIAADENSAMAGVVTLEQADATFIDLNIHADDTIGAAFAEFTTLKLGEIPVFKTRQEYPIRVNMGHLAGTPPTVFFATAQTGTQVAPFQYFSEEFLVPNLVNANFDVADFKEREIAMARIVRDMGLARQKYIINLMLGQPLTQDLVTSLTAYETSTPFTNRNPYVLDPGVRPGSVPNTNIIDNTSEGGLTRTVFMKQRTWANQMERELVRMFVPIEGAPWEAYWSQASIVAYTTGNGNQNVSKAVPPSKWEETVNTSFRKKGAYMRWFDDSPIYVQPSNILPAGYSIISTELPAVLGWDQLSEAVSDEESIKANRAFNRRYEARSMALAQPDPLLRNFVVQKIA